MFSKIYFPFAESILMCMICSVLLFFSNADVDMWGLKREIYFLFSLLREMDIISHDVIVFCPLNNPGDIYVRTKLLPDSKYKKC